ncbi:hypothetical protein BpHYR1_044525 [Brachionus plicatilis]|uniref:Uncharacterized protein n=1 Tax=Brachionus plicatilis TaxID=10195 RepID=A0A3M7SZ24_BRAPC|nr:hypothetical protein BpHYR1_044525 [Brachionus plicatilis]
MLQIQVHYQVENKTDKDKKNIRLFNDNILTKAIASIKKIKKINLNMCFITNVEKIFEKKSNNKFAIN